MSMPAKPCPLCGRLSDRAFDSGGLDTHTGSHVVHEVFKNVMHGHLFTAGAWAIGGGIKAVMPKKYHCQPCKHSFTV